MLYAQIPARRSRQIAGDLAVLAWIALWVAFAYWLHGQLLRLAAPGRSLQSAGRGLADSLRAAGDKVGSIPLAGDALKAPLTAGSDAGRTLEHAGVAQQHAVSHLALWLPLLVAAMPIGYVLLRRLGGRLRWIRRANAAARVQASAGDSDLFALRALARQPIAELRRVSVDPAAAWRRGDPAIVRALAGLELRELGLRG